MARYFYDPSTGTWGAADDLEIIEIEDALDADDVEEALAEASVVGAGFALVNVLNALETDLKGLADRLDAGVIADIFYDAADHGDESAEAVIEDFQQACIDSAVIFRNLTR